MTDKKIDSEKKKSERRQRQQFIRARCTAEEKQQAEARAQERGLTLGDFIRVKVLEVKPLKREKKATPHREAVLLLRAEMNKIGSNINQIARAMNRKDSATQDQVGVVINQLLELQNLVKQFLEKDK